MSNSIKKDLTIIIISFNSGQIILETLGELIKAFPANVIIVDNASIDDSQALFASAFPNVEVIDLPVNIGYGRAANVALKRIDTEYSLLINPDILLTEIDLNKIFIHVSQHKENTAIFSPALKRKDFVKKGDIFVDYLIGAFLLFNMKALKDVGFFDENIFLFYEEKDIEFRFIQRGYKLALLSDIFVKHIGSASTVSSPKIVFLRNWHVAWSKYYYSYKHGIFANKIPGYLLLLKYGLKAFINKGDKKIKYKARYMGAKAYMRGKKSFASDGCGKYSDIL